MSLFEVNYLSITVWTLIGVLLLVLAGFFIWRVTKGKRKPGEGRKLSPLKGSKATIQIALAMNAVYGFKALANVLVKNRYAKVGFSLMPVVVERNGHVFLISNLVDAGSGTVHVGRLNGQLDAWFQRRKTPSPCLNWLFSYSHDWERFVKGLGFPVKVVRIVPVVGDIVFEAKDSGIVFCPLQDLGKTIDVMSATPTPEASEIDERFLAALSNLNLFSKKGQSPRKLMKGMLE